MLYANQTSFYIRDLSILGLDMKGALEPILCVHGGISLFIFWTYFSSFLSFFGLSMILLFSSQETKKNDKNRSLNKQSNMILIKLFKNVSLSLIWEY